MLLGGEPHLGVDDAVGGQVHRALAGHPAQRRRAVCMTRDGVRERLQVALQRAGVGRLGEPPARARRGRAAGSSCSRSRRRARRWSRAAGRRRGGRAAATFGARRMSPSDSRGGERCLVAGGSSSRVVSGSVPRALRHQGQPMTTVKTVTTSVTSWRTLLIQPSSATTPYRSNVRWASATRRRHWRRRPCPTARSSSTWTPELAAPPSPVAGRPAADLRQPAAHQEVGSSGGPRRTSSTTTPADSPAARASWLLRWGGHRGEVSPAGTAGLAAWHTNLPVEPRVRSPRPKATSSFHPAADLPVVDADGAAAPRRRDDVPSTPAPGSRYHPEPEPWTGAPVTVRGTVQHTHRRQPRPRQQFLPVGPSAGARCLEFGVGEAVRGRGLLRSGRDRRARGSAALAVAGFEGRALQAAWSSVVGPSAPRRDRPDALTPPHTSPPSSSCCTPRPCDVP